MTTTSVTSGEVSSGLSANPFNFVEVFSGGTIIDTFVDLGEDEILFGGVASFTHIVGNAGRPGEEW